MWPDEWDRATAMVHDVGPSGAPRQGRVLDRDPDAPAIDIEVHHMLGVGAEFGTDRRQVLAEVQRADDVIDRNDRAPPTAAPGTPRNPRPGRGRTTGG